MYWYSCRNKSKIGRNRTNWSSENIFLLRDKREDLFRCNLSGASKNSVPSKKKKQVENPKVALDCHSII